MPTDNENRQGNLRAQIEDLAVRAVLADPPSNDSFREFAAALAEISVQAEPAGCRETALAAAALGNALTADPDRPAPDAASLADGIARLQAILESETQRCTPGPGVNPLAQDPELLGDFVVESREHLASVEAQALVLEQQPGNEEAIHSLFRSFHTIKGLAGFLDLAAIQEMAHEVETALDLARNGKVAITSEVIDVILASSDYLQRLLRDVDATLAGQAPPPRPHNPELAMRLRALAGGTAPAAVTVRACEPETDSSGPGPVTAPPVLVEQPAPVEPVANAAPDPAAGAIRRTAPAESYSVRVETSKLDYLMDMVGEMVIAQSLIRHDPTLETAPSPNLARNLSQLARITAEVQRTAMVMRMVPIGQLFQRTSRLVRDTSRKAEKKVVLDISGEDTELDKTIAEKLSDPLLHMVRNAVDHGVEPPEERVAAGKPEAGKVRLAAYHQGGQIVIEVGDDGRGLNREKILRKARQRGLALNDNITDAEVFNLIFEPGFSTADQVTDVSGRGVGMDVVRKQVQKLRGRVDIESQAGRGTRFIIRLPLTLAIIDGLVVGVGSYRYIVPIFAVREVFRPAPDAISTVQGTHEMVLVHGRLLPLVRLSRRFGITGCREDPCEAVVIVSETDDRQFCMMVDELIGKQEVVIKSLGEMLKNIPGVAGGTILGDGRVGLILEMEGVFTGEHNE